MFKKIKEFFAAEKYEKEVIEDNIRPEYKDNLGLCRQCDWIFTLNDGERIELYSGWMCKLTEDELWSIPYHERSKWICKECIAKNKQRTKEFEVSEKLKKVECEKLAKAFGLETETVLYFVNKIK